MPKYIAFVRGINVGGKHALPMASLKAELESIGLTNVRTYIQSGNVVFEAGRQSTSSLAAQIMDTVEQHHGFRPAVMVLTGRQLRLAIENNPFPGATAEPTTLHFYFLAAAPGKPDLLSLDKVKASDESYQLTKAVFYLHTPSGLGRSKLANCVERYLGVAATARNFRTVEKVHQL